jgi:DNA-binding MarR family transcriptional regulator
MLLSFTRHGELPLGKIGARLQVHAASVTNAIDRLESQDLVKRVPHPRDGRTTLARITTTGRRTALQATRVLNDEVFRDPGLEGQDLRDTVAALARVRRADFSEVTSEMASLSR